MIYSSSHSVRLYFILKNSHVLPCRCVVGASSSDHKPVATRLTIGLQRPRPVWWWPPPHAQPGGKIQGPTWGLRVRFAKSSKVEADLPLPDRWGDVPCRCLWRISLLSLEVLSCTQFSSDQNVGLIWGCTDISLI